MSIINRILNPKTRRPDGVDVRGVAIIPTQCPLCGNTGDFRFDPNSHQFWSVVEIAPKTHLHVLECPYCKAGMLLCIRDGRMLGIEGYKDTGPPAMMAAVERARARWT